MIREIEEKIRTGAAKHGFSLYPGGFINKDSKTCCVIGALELYNCDIVPYSEDETFSIAKSHGMTSNEALSLEAGFENWGENYNTRKYSDLYYLGLRLRGEVIRVEQAEEE